MAKALWKPHSPPCCRNQSEHERRTLSFHIVRISNHPSSPTIIGAHLGVALARIIARQCVRVIDHQIRLAAGSGRGGRVKKSVCARYLQALEHGDVAEGRAG